MSNDKMRAEFEAWAVSEGYAIACMISGHYIYAVTSAAWNAWQASRAALVVELPSTVGYEGQYDGCDSELSEDWADFQCADVTYSLARKVEVKEAIEAAGVKVKP